MKKPLNKLNISTEYLKKISRMNLSAEQRNKIKPQKIIKKNSESHKIIENKKMLNLNNKENYSNLNNKIFSFLHDENKKFNFNFNYNKYIKILNNINKEMIIFIETNIKNNSTQKIIKDELNKKIELFSNYLNTLFLNLEKYQNDILNNLKINLDFNNNEKEKNNFLQNEKISFYINNLCKLIKNYKINQQNLNDNLISSLNKLNVNLNLNNFNKNLDLFYNNSKNIFKNLKDIQNSNLNININNNKLNFTNSEIINNYNNNNNENIIKKINLKNSYSTNFMKKNLNNNNNCYNLNNNNNNNNNNKLNKSISKEKLKTLSKIHNSFSNLFEHNYIMTNPNEFEYDKNNNTNSNSKKNFNMNEYISTNKNSNEIFNLKNSFYSSSITEENTYSNNYSNYNNNNNKNQINFISQKIIDFFNIMKNLQNFIIKKDSNNVSKLKKEFEISKKNLEIMARNNLIKKNNININNNNNNKNIIIIDDYLDKKNNKNNNNISFNKDLNKLKQENEALKIEIKKINEKNKKNNFNGISQIKLREFENIIKNQKEKIDSLIKEKTEINKELKNYLNLNKDCNSLLIQIKKIIFEKNLILNNETLNNLQNLFNNNKNIFDDATTLNNIYSEISNGLPNNSIEEENKKLKKLFEECINIINNSIKENSEFLVNNNNISDSDYSQKILLTENSESEENSIDNIIKNSLFNFNIKNNDSNDDEILENTIKKNNSINIENIKSAVKLFSTYNNEINICIKKLKDENSKIKYVNKELTEELNNLSINNVEEKEFKIDFNSNTEIFTLKSLESGKNKKPINFTESQKNKYLQKEIIRLKSIIEQLKIDEKKDKKVDINITLINALTNLLNEINLTNKIKEYFDIIFKLLGLNEENINKIYNNKKNKHKFGIY